jgi:hypothetical protein
MPTRDTLRQYEKTCLPVLQALCCVMCARYHVFAGRQPALIYKFDMAITIVKSW